MACDRASAEHELIGRLDVDVRRRGADDHFVLVSSSPGGEALRAPTGRVLEPGDVVNVEISPSVDGQFVQICRTAVLGAAGADRRRDYALIVTALREGMAAARPGARVADVVAALDAPLVAAGLGEYCRPPHIRVRGHGQGLASLSPGDIALRQRDAARGRDAVHATPQPALPRQRLHALRRARRGHRRRAPSPLTERTPGLDEC